ncbi:MAG: hypothetical protein ABFS16_13270 [Bacteroidota bacterium]
MLEWQFLLSKHITISTETDEFDALIPILSGQVKKYTEIKCLKKRKSAQIKLIKSIQPESKESCRLKIIPDETSMNFNLSNSQKDMFKLALAELRFIASYISYS